MNHHSKICDHGLANDLAVSTLLLLIKHYQKKRKVVTQTGCWNNLLQTKRRYNSWWSKIKLLCKMNWKRTSKWPYFLPGGSTKWYFFPTILYQCRTLVNCWGKLCKTQKLKKNALLWHIANVMNRYACTKKQFVFKVPIQLLSA